jgi:hypothetical protein
MKPADLREGDLLARYERLLCPEHAMRLSHVCREAKCPYSLLCADCLATNTPHVQLHKAWLEPLHWVEARFSAIKGSKVHGSLSQLVDLVARLA